MATARELFGLDGEIAFVTGAASGIGRAIAVGLAELGAAVGLADLPGTDLEGAQQRIEQTDSPGCVIAPLDVRNPAALAAGVRHVEETLGGPLTLAVNAAGIGRSMPAIDMPLAAWQEMIDTNLTGVFLSCQAEARAMLPQRRGAIVNIASMSGTIVNRGIPQAHYNAAKAAVAHLTRSLAMEWCPHGIRVNSVSPGYTATPLSLRPGVAEDVPRLESETPMGRMATPEEMVGPTVFLLSRAASYCTGVDLLVDGGFTCW